MLRFNHMEITLPLGTIERDGDTLAAFMGDVFGFARKPFPGALDHPGMVLAADQTAEQFLFLAEHPSPLPKASDDHLGFVLPSKAEVDQALEQCRAWQQREPRIEIRDFGTQRFGRYETTAFYVRFVLPIWLDVQFFLDHGEDGAAAEGSA